MLQSFLMSHLYHYCTEDEHLKQLKHLSQLHLLSAQDHIWLSREWEEQSQEDRTWLWRCDVKKVTEDLACIFLNVAARHKLKLIFISDFASSWDRGASTFDVIFIRISKTKIHTAHAGDQNGIGVRGFFEMSTQPSCLKKIDIDIFLHGTFISILHWRCTLMFLIGDGLKNRTFKTQFYSWFCELQCAMCFFNPRSTLNTQAVEVDLEWVLAENMYTQPICSKTSDIAISLHGTFIALLHWRCTLDELS